MKNTLISFLKVLGVKIAGILLVVLFLFIFPRVVSGATKISQLSGDTTTISGLTNGSIQCTGDPSSVAAYKIAQSFMTPLSSDVTLINVRLKMTGNQPQDSVFVSIYSDFFGNPGSFVKNSDLVSSTIIGSEGFPAIVDFLINVNLLQNTRYWFILDRISYVDCYNYTYVGAKRSVNNPYSIGELRYLQTSNDIYWSNLPNDDLFFELTFESTQKLPIIILPGILGSWTDDFIRPFKNQVPIPQNELSLTEESKAKFWLKWANLGYLPQTWNDLKTKLPELGYPLYKCPYDWRLPNTEIARDYLIPCIDKAKQETGASKVDIAAHSMGGLVARAYIQDDLVYRNDIDKFVMLGTPNHGSVKAYDFWEGADSSGGLLSSLGTVLESSIGNALISMGVHNTRKGLLDYVHTFLPSVRELLPTFSYLKDQFGNTRNVTSMSWQNDFLNNLNNEPSISRLTSEVKTKVFAGEGYDTLSNISVLYPNPDNTSGDKAQPYPDGQPIPLLKQNTTLGDETVLSQASAQITETGVQFHTKAKQSSDGKHFLEHVNLPNSFVNEVISFLGGTSTVDNIYLPNMPESVLSISLASPAELLVIDPQGRKVGFDSSLGVEMNEVPSGVYSGKDELELVSIANPEPGDYRVVVAGNADGEFNTGVSYANSSCGNNIAQENYGYAQVGKLTNFTINFHGGCVDNAVSYSLNAKVELEPEKINFNSRAGYITAEIELPSPYKTEQIDISKIRLNDKILPVLPKVKHKDRELEHRSDNSKNNYDELEVKFKRSEVVGILQRGVNKIIISGNLLDGTKFSGSDTLVVIGKKQ